MVCHVMVHGKTQNQNEALNGLVWQRVSKETYVGRDTLELGLYDAVAHFTMGCKSAIKLFESLDIDPSWNTIDGCTKQDQTRVNEAERKRTTEVKKRRKVLRGQKKRKDDKKKQAEDTMYAPGQF